MLPIALWAGIAGANRQFVVLQHAGDFELVENTGTPGTITISEGKRCFIRSRFDRAAPTFFLYPATNKWNLQLPDDVVGAADWEDRNIHTAGYPGLAVYFKVSVDGGEAFEIMQAVRNIDPMKKRYVNFPEPALSTVYAALLNADVLAVDWKHDGLGTQGDRFIREILNKPIPLGKARYNARGIADLLEAYDDECKAK